MATYTYTLEAAKQYDLSGLVTQCQAAGLPVFYVNGSPGANAIQVVTDRALSMPELDALAALVAAYDGRPRRKRKPYDIYTDIGAMSGTQKTNIANDLFGGSPPKFTQD